MEDEKVIWTAYAKDNEEDIKAYSKEIDFALIHYYNFKECYRPEQPINSFNNQLNSIDVRLHKERKTAQDAAKIIYNTVIANGDDGNPEIFKSSYSIKTLPRFYKFNKAIFGSYNPPAKTVIVLSTIFLVLGLVYYAIPGILLGPNHDVFIASKDWKDIATPMIWALTITVIFLTFRSKEYRQRMAKLYGQIDGVFRQIAIIFVIFFCLHFALQIGAGKLLNELLGTEQKVQMIVTKDPDTRKRSAKHNIDAYCVKIENPDSSIFGNEYCIKKEHYDKLPDNSPIIMRFHGTKSFFGFRIDGYYEGYQNTHQA